MNQLDTIAYLQNMWLHFPSIPFLNSINCLRLSLLQHHQWSSHQTQGCCLGLSDCLKRYPKSSKDQEKIDICVHT